MGTIDMRPRAEREAALRAYTEDCNELFRNSKDSSLGPVRIEFALRDGREFILARPNLEEAHRLIREAALEGLRLPEDVMILPREIDRYGTVFPTGAGGGGFYVNDIFTADLRSWDSF